MLCRHGLHLRFCGGLHRQQQAAGGLRIAQQAAPGVRHIAHQVAVARKVTAGAARHRALRDVFFNAWQFRHGLIPELRLQARALAYFAEVPQQSEAGDIRHRPHAVDLCEISARFIHGAHHFCRKILMFRAQQRFSQRWSARRYPAAW